MSMVKGMTVRVKPLSGREGMSTFQQTFVCFNGSKLQWSSTVATYLFLVNRKCTIFQNLICT
ncbi:hypothetical protein C0J52_21493 [Blattella germanica]|nr:hypothetical protein C0J52_21493 [Blattella germanica]